MSKQKQVEQKQVTELERKVLDAVNDGFVWVKEVIAATGVNGMVLGGAITTLIEKKYAVVREAKFHGTRTERAIELTDAGVLVA
jgi:hypothetical protein